MPILMASAPMKKPTRNNKNTELFAFVPSLFGVNYSFMSEKIKVASKSSSSKSSGA